MSKFSTEIVRVLSAIALLAVLAGIASAQSYQIQVRFTVRLRASYDLDSPVVGKALAGDVLQVVDRYNRWLKIERDGVISWLADWVEYTRLDQEQSSPGEAATNPQQRSNIDNCCFVNRQCHSDREWVEGYWAYQRDQCGGRTQSSSRPASEQGSQTDNCCFIGWQCHSDSDWQLGYRAFQDRQCDKDRRQAEPTVVIPQGIDNCCYVNRQCNTDAEWKNGWLIFQHFQCNIPPATQGISIQGSGKFVAQVSNALRLLRDRAPQWWKYATRGLNTIKMIAEGGVSGVFTSSKTYEETLSEVMRDGTGEAGLVYVIFGIVHEACHVNEDHRYADGLDEEKACMQASLYALQEINPADRSTLDWIQWIIDNIHDPDVQWW